MKEPRLLVGLALLLAPSDTVLAQQEPVSALTGLTATAVTYGEISLTWTDNATNEGGFRIERRQGQTGTWSVIDSVGPNTVTFTDRTPALLPQTECCYRVTAFNADGNSGYSNESCATTLAIPPIPCAPDIVDARRALTGLLASSHPALVEWKAEVGLSTADPSTLVLVNDDAICRRIWAAVNTRPPDDAYAEVYAATFWQVDGLYILRESLIAPWTTGSDFTTVVTPQFESVKPSLAF